MGEKGLSVMQRRRFLQCLGGALILAGCGADSGSTSSGFSGGSLPSGAALPNGYRFEELWRSGDVLPNGGSIDKFPGSALINDRNEVYVHAIDQQGAMGVYRVQLDLGGTKARLERSTLLARDGDTMPGGGVITHVELGSTNASGEYALSTTLSEGDPKLYFYPEGQQPMPSLGLLSPAPGTDGVFSNELGDFELTRQGTVLISGSFARQAITQKQAGQGLFLLPQGSPGSGRLLMAQGDIVPGTSTTIGGFGMVDGDGSDPNYLAEVFAGLEDLGPDDHPDGSQAELILTDTYDGTSPRILVVSPQVVLPGSLRGRVLQQQARLAPRLAEDGAVGAILDSGGIEQFRYRDQVVMSTGQLSPLNRVVTGFCSPVVGPDGLCAVLASTEDGGMEIIVTDGSRTRTILSDGVALNGSTIAKIGLGLVRGQANLAGFMSFIVEYQDGRQALVLGRPV